ncbi:NAD(P)-binding protein [Sporormia fimetaria CBS 119925]|uniref:NAD(P)-binding protein n=1 Tax=Sporormia fimetaria CBS 119925 TaxID=1340428 RepID=A0A6A6VIY0_9PLEO|nr:NAD(P)-binding protein [Sporormia fimetaria CBS 119925]
MKPWALVTPASRGIGLALTREILRTTTIPVVATARTHIPETKSKILEGLDVDEKRLTVLPLDVLDEPSISRTSTHLSTLYPPSTHSLHLSFLFPGIIHPEKSPQQIDAEKALLTFRTNTLGPLLLLKHFSAFLPTKKSLSRQNNGIERGKENPDNHNEKERTGLPNHSTTALMAARVGSISDNSLGGWYSYRSSKSGVLQIAKTFDNHLKLVSGPNAIAIALHPGTVKTGLSEEFWASVERRGGRLFSAEEAAGNLMRVVVGMSVEGRGRCWDWRGREVRP